ELSAVCVQGFAGERERRLSERLVLRRMRVDELCDVFGERLPVDGQRRLADLLAHPVADHVDSEERAALLADELDDAGGCEDLALTVAAEVVLVGFDVAIFLTSLLLGEPDRCDLGVAVRDPRDPGVDDRHRVEPGDLLGDEDAVGETAVRQLYTGYAVADGLKDGYIRRETLVGRDPAAVEGHALLLVPQSGGVRSAADGDKNEVCLERLAGLQRDAHLGLGLLCLRELRAGLEADLAF